MSDMWGDGSKAGNGDADMSAPVSGAWRSEPVQGDAATRVQFVLGQLAASINEAPFGIVMLDRDLRVLAASRQFLIDQGVPASVAIMGRMHHEVFPHLPPQWVEACRRAIERGVELGAEEDSFVRPDGAVEWARWTMRPWRTVSGNIGGLVLFAEIITRRVELNRALEAARARSAFMLELGETLRALGDPDAMITSASELLGRHLAVAQVGFAEVDDAQAWATLRHAWRDRGIADAAGHWRLDELGASMAAELRAGRTIRIADVEADPRVEANREDYARLGVRATVGVSLVRGGRIRAVMFVNDTAPRVWTDAEIELIEEVCQRLWSAMQRIIAEQRLRDSEALLSAVIDALPVGIVIADAEGAILRDNAVHRELWGMAPVTESWRQYGDWIGYRPDTGERLKAEEWGLARALLHGEVVRNELVENERFGTGERRYFLNNAAPVRDGDGHVIGGVVAELDVTEQQRAEQQVTLLNNELHHRVKNTLATVQAIAMLLARTEPDVAAFNKAFSARLQALSRTHDLLLDGRGEHVPLRDLLRAELTPYDGLGGRRVTLDGPDVVLPPKMAVALGMAFHELATNAAKHGALGHASGKLTVGWQVAREASGRRLRLEWCERGVAVDAAPTRKGFGSQLLDRVLGLQLHAEVQRSFATDGLHVGLSMPLDG